MGSWRQRQPVENSTWETWALRGGAYWESGSEPSEGGADSCVGAALEPGCWEEPQARQDRVMPPGSWSLWGLDWTGRGRGRPTLRRRSRGGSAGRWASGQRESLGCFGGRQGEEEVGWEGQWTVGSGERVGQRVSVAQADTEKPPWLHPEPPSEDYHTHTDCGQQRREESRRQNVWWGRKRQKKDRGNYSLELHTLSNKLKIFNTANKKWHDMTSTQYRYYAEAICGAANTHKAEHWGEIVSLRNFLGTLLRFPPATSSNICGCWYRRLHWKSILLLI